MLLADMGAQVIKVERPDSGDETRGWAPPFDAGGRSTYFQSVNRNKESVTCDLSSRSGQQRAMELISSCDVLVENFTVGGMEKFGLGFEFLAQKYPALIYCSISGFGSSAAASNLPGYDLLVQAMSGLMSITGEDSQHPSKVGVALVDVTAGLHAALGITAALYHRSQSGLGQRIEINLLSSALSAMVNQSGAYTGAGVIPTAMGNAHPSIAPYEMYQGADLKFIIAAGTDGHFAKLFTLLGQELDHYPEFLTNTGRVKFRTQLNALITPILAQRSANYWISECRKVGVPAGPINNIGEGIALAQELELSPIVEIIDPRDGFASRTIAHPIKFSRTPAQYYLGPPALGADN